MRQCDTYGFAKSLQSFSHVEWSPSA
jgi:hypothetical protein